MFEIGRNRYDAKIRITAPRIDNKPGALSVGRKKERSIGNKTPPIIEKVSTAARETFSAAITQLHRRSPLDIPERTAINKTLYSIDSKPLRAQIKIETKRQPTERIRFIFTLPFVPVEIRPQHFIADILIMAVIFAKIRNKNPIHQAPVFIVITINYTRNHSSKQEIKRYKNIIFRNC